MYRRGERIGQGSVGHRLTSGHEVELPLPAERRGLRRARAQGHVDARLGGRAAQRPRGHFQGRLLHEGLPRARFGQGRPRHVEGRAGAVPEPRAGLRDARRPPLE